MNGSHWPAWAGLAAAIYLWNHHGTPVPSKLPTDQALEFELRESVRVLSALIGERHSHRPASLEAAARYIEGEMVRAGFVPFSDHYAAGGVALRNVVALRQGTGGAIVVGAHYDSVPGSPG